MNCEGDPPGFASVSGVLPAADSSTASGVWRSAEILEKLEAFLKHKHPLPASSH